MHRKRVTSELHDSYFRLVTIKHSISKIQWVIVWALNYYIIELSWVPKQLPADFQTVETRCGNESHTRPMGLEALMNWGPENMLIRCIKKASFQQWTPRPLVEHLREQERHNVMVISSGGQNMKFMFGLQHPLTCKP